MNNLYFIIPELFISLSVMVLLVLGVFKKDSSKLIFNISLIAPDVYHLDVVPSIVLISDVYKITIISFFMVLLSSIYPAKKAIDITPSQSLNL